MPKNAVERLQKLHEEIKSVISIYDAANLAPTDSVHKNCYNKHESLGFNRKKLPETQVETVPRSQQAEILENREPNFDGAAKELYSSPPTTAWTSLPSKKHWPYEKPGSAPSCTSTSTGNCETDSLLGLSLSTNSCRKSDVDKVSMPESKLMSGSECKSSITNESILKPSKTLQKSKQILEKYRYRNEEASDVDQSCETGCNGNTDYSEYYESDASSGLNALRGGRVNFEFVQNGSAFNSRIPTRSRSESPRKKPSCHQNQGETAKRPVTGKDWSELQKEKSSSRGPQFPNNEVPKKIPRLDKRKCTAAECTTATSRANSKEKGKLSGGEDSADLGSHKKGENLKTSVESKRFNQKSSTKQDENDGKTCTNLCLANGKKETEDHHVKSHRSNDCVKSSQNTIKSKNLKNSEFEVNELSRIIAKSNEKLEKMKVSKNLAIDIAKQLKSKYDEIKSSKNKLMDRLQQVEKDNERLNNEVKNERDSKVKLQRNIENLKTESKALLKEQDVKTKEVLDENVSLKAIIKVMEKEHTEHVADADLQLKTRFSDKNAQSNQSIHVRCNSSLSANKTEDEHTESVSSLESTPKAKKEKRLPEPKELRGPQEDIRRLTNENSQLQLKVKELGILLRDRQFQVDSLEKKMKELENEFKKQKHHLKQKTERLEDTNRELESIRKNSWDLEEQIKVLRQSIENLDEMHQNMMGKSGLDENQIKKLQERIAQLEGERDKLKNDLENEKDSLLIKNKIIEDQQETIKQLREKSEETKNLLKKNQSLERLINIERDEKLELQDAIERLKWRKEELKRKIKALEGDLLLAPQEVVRDLQKTQTVLHELENQVQIKQKEWELHLQSLIKEREQARSVAEYATKKLWQTTSEFQKQSEAHKRLHKVLAENLAEKERYLREVNERISQSQLKGMLAEAEAETQRLVRLTCYTGGKELDENAEIWQARKAAASPSTKCVDCEERRKFTMNF